MNTEELRKLLDRLRSEVESVKFRNPQARERVQRLITGIEHQLRHADNAERKETLFRDITATIRQFETEHPSLTATLDRIVSTLSSMGI